MNTMKKAYVCCFCFFFPDKHGPVDDFSFFLMAAVVETLMSFPNFVAVEKQDVVTQVASEVLCVLNPATEVVATQFPDFLTMAAVAPLVDQFHCIVLGVVPGGSN